VMDHWVDVVLPGYPPSPNRVASADIRATFMAWEIVLAIQRAAAMADLPLDAARRIFYENGMERLAKVMGGRAMARAADRQGG